MLTEKSRSRVYTHHSAWVVIVYLWLPPNVSKCSIGTRQQQYQLEHDPNASV